MEFSNDLPNHTLSKEELLPLIIAQLQSYDLYTIAESLALSTGTPMPEPSNRLAEICADADLSDDEQEMVEHIAMDEEPSMPEEALIVEDKEYEPKKAPNWTSVFTTTHKLAVTTAAFSNDGNFICTGSSDTSLKVLDVFQISQKDAANKASRTLYDHVSRVNEVTFHPNNIVLASCSDDATIKLYDLTRTKGKKAFKYLKDSFPVRSISFHPSGDYLISGTEHEAIRIYEVKTLRCFTSSSQNIHSGPVNSVFCSPSGAFFASGSSDGSIKLHDITTGSILQTLERAHEGTKVSSVRISKNESYVLSCGMDSVVRLWDIKSGRCVQKYEGAKQTSQFLQARFNYNEDFVLSTDQTTHQIVIWDSRACKQIKTLAGHNAVVRCLATSPVDNSFVSGSDVR